MAVISARQKAVISENIKLIPMVMNQMAEYDKRQTRIEHTLFGNDKLGMDERIRNIEKYIELQIEKEKRRAAWWDRFQWIIIPMALSGLVVFIGQAVIFYFKIFPLIEKLK